MTTIKDDCRTQLFCTSWFDRETCPSRTCTFSLSIVRAMCQAHLHVKTTRKTVWRNSSRPGALKNRDIIRGYITKGHVLVEQGYAVKNGKCHEADILGCQGVKISSLTFGGRQM